MAKLTRVAALVLCMLMLLPSSLAIAAASGLNDIIDEDSAATGAPADPTAEVVGVTPTPDAPSFVDLANATAGPNAAAQAETSLQAPSFGSVDTTKSITDSLTNAGSTDQQAADITKNSKYKATEGKMGVLVDSKLSTYWSNKKKAKIQITLPANDTAGGLYVEWSKKPSAFQIVEYDSAGKELRTRDQSAYTGLVSVYPLLPETKKIELVFSKQVRIATMRVFSQGALPTSIQNWLAPHEKADLMVVATHPNEEFLYFGGAIPYYSAARDKAVQVVFMAASGRARYGEALNALWYAGERNSPDFIGLPDKQAKTLKDAKKVWKTDAVIEQLVARIRKYKPEVVVSMDEKGEFGDGLHMLTAESVKKAVELAADEAKYKASADAYGVWQVQKLYLHLYPEKQITLDWTGAAGALGGKSPAEAAKLAYAAHKSQQKKYPYQDGGKYDNSKFGLAYSMVGDDVEKNDFFENIVEGAARLNPAGTANGEPVEDTLDDTDEYIPDEDFFGDEDSMIDDDFPVLDTGYSDDGEPIDDGYQADDANVAAPVESGAPANTGALLGTLIGVPVVLGGSAIGTVTARKAMKKKRRAARKAEKDQMSA